MMTLPLRVSLFMLVGSLAMLATGCSPAQQVVGKWNLDTAKSLSVEPSVNSETKAFMSMMTIFQPKIDVTFEGNGSYNISGAVGPQSISKNGSWRFVKMDGKTLVLMVKEAGKTDESELRVTLADSDHAEMNMPLTGMGAMKMPAMHFVRVKPAS